ncbi:MAG: type II toxin-antitoxin system VapC family toxin [Acidobacteriota bacterium]|nr:type II toxin-antitoxin system VapC family toxin [Acidobacteriota bacterium]
MAAYFLDSSAAVKRYIREAGTAWIINLFRPQSFNQIFVAEIILAEVISALARRLRGKSLSVSNYNRSVARFRRTFDQKFFPVEINLPLIERASYLAENYGLRGYDAVQLAAGLTANDARIAIKATALIFVSADNDLNNAALAEGLSVENPNNYP